ncbi:hypothetical protein FNW02_04150 [Komarekiella sp. 'clone 1']|uniref:Uncharacterized protein n=1 Tax=Komarekiella delphini-convector SJRDD-AB1 TaxID=2593771 RepID=A0AA40STN4_9NOST|nr:hypothetical protein [Komarekiella delphini-convector]MBD6615063.1 hypothetical protein [Komarekiella delphini-convector SJRDD-AB1]
MQSLFAAKIIHLTTHALLDDTDQSIPSAIVFAPSGQCDGLLTLTEIVDLSINAAISVEVTTQLHEESCL